MREMGFGKQIAYFIMNARTTEKGSRTLVHASQAGPESHGRYMTDCGVHDPAAWVLSDEGKKTSVRVWDELSKKLESIQPGVLGNL